VFEVASEACEDLPGPITEFMTGAADLQVPLVVDIGTGANWDEAH
jgi:DNA polymerase-1